MKGKNWLRFVGVVASPRRGGNAATFTKYALECLHKRGMETEFLQKRWFLQERFYPAERICSALQSKG